MNEERPFQLRNRNAYEVEILVPPSQLDSLPKADWIRPAVMEEVGWLLPGTPVTQIVACADGTLARHPITKEFKASLPEALRPHLERVLGSR